MPEYDSLSDKEILDRIKLADTWLKKYRDADVQASYRYIDANAPASGSGEDWSLDDEWFDQEGDAPDWVPIGQVNYMTINNETKIAAIAMGIPALHVKADEQSRPGAGERVSKAWEQTWRNGNWKRETNSALQKLGICGLGCVWLRWDDIYGPCMEHVSLRRLLLDPHATNFSRLEWGGVKVKMSVRRAMRLYDPNGENEFFKTFQAGMNDGKNPDNQVVSIAIYFDRKDEVHTYNDKVIHRDRNLYRRVPLFFIEGFLDPRDRLMPLGDNVFASGLNQQIVDLAQMASNTAKHGGPINFGNANSFDERTREALEKGQQQQVIFIKGPLNPQAMPLARLQAEQLSPAYGVARQEAQQALDAVQGVTPGARGQMLPGVTATQSVMTENKAGARPMQARSDYEAWIKQIALFWLEMMQRFGGPDKANPGTRETAELWDDFKATYDLDVIEGSASYQNPAADQQASMQVYSTMVQSMELYLSLAQMGAIQVLPNLKQYADDMLRAFSRQNIEQYWVPAPQPQQAPQGPPPELIRALQSLYKDSPPDVRRQIEQNFGLSPSQLGDSPEDDGSGQQLHERMMQAGEQGHDAAMKALDHAHEMRMEQMRQEHANTQKVADMGHQMRMADLQRKMQPKDKGNGK